MLDPSFSDCRLPTADCRDDDLPSRAREARAGLLMDLCGLAAIALFVAAAQMWCGGLAG